MNIRRSWRASPICEDLLAHPDKIRALVRDDILMLKEKFGDERRSMIAVGASGDFNEEDLIAQDNVLISYSAGSYIKRMSASDVPRAGPWRPRRQGHDHPPGR